MRSTTTITKTTPQASVEVMINLLPIELLVQKVGISAYIRLKSQLNNPCAALNTRHLPHMQYWEKHIKEYNIKMPQTDESNKRVWKKIQCKFRQFKRRQKAPETLNIPYTLMEVKRKKEQEEDSWYTTTTNKCTHTVSKC